MGAGAGYTIEVKNAKFTGDIQINSFEKTGETSNTMFSYDVYSVDCNVQIIGSIKADSYMYGCDWIENVPMTVNNVIVNFMKYEDAPEVTEADIVDILENNQNYIGSGVYGGGWVHSTFDGTFEIQPDNDYADDISEVTITIDHPNIVNFIDLAVTGDNKEYEVVFNGDGQEAFEDEDEAIAYLKDLIREEITENGIDSIDFYDCYVTELYWTEDVDGNFDYVDFDGYIVYRAETDIDEFEALGEAAEELNEENDVGIDEGFDI